MKHWLTLALVCTALHAAAFDLQGHRGARGLAPENTLPGFARALGIGVTTLETDLAISRDGVLLISHDPALNPEITRGADGRFLTGRGPVIWHTDFAELQRYDVGRIAPGTRYAAQFAAQQPHDGARLPRLEDLFALVRRSGNGTVRLALEIKTRPPHPLPDPAARHRRSRRPQRAPRQRPGLLRRDRDLRQRPRRGAHDHDQGHRRGRQPARRGELDRADRAR